MYNVDTIRPVTNPGWYETVYGRAAYFQKSFGHVRWHEGMPDMICTDLRWPSEVRHLVDSLL